MKAFQMVGWQQPPELREVDVPEPGPGEILVKVGGSGACHSDLHLMEWPGGMLPWEFPFTLGHEPAGWIEALGPGVEGFEVGEAVAVHGPWGCGSCRNCRVGLETLCDKGEELGYAGAGLGRDGGMAEYIVVPSARHLVRLGELDPALAAPLGDAALTPYRAVKRFLHYLVPGSAAVVVGAGGLGHMAIQILKAVSPARVVAVDVSEAKLDLARELGADDVATPSAAEDVVRAATGGLGAELVLDIVGSTDSMSLGVRLLRRPGAFVLIGLALGSIPFNFFAIPYDAVLATSYWGTVSEFMEVVELAKAGKIHVEVERFPLEEAAEVYRKLKDGEIRGRAVVVP